MNLLQIAGALLGKGFKNPRYAPVFIDKTFTGIFTQRSPLHDPSSQVWARFYGGRPDVLIDGLNVELTNNLTLARRPGLSEYNGIVYPTVPNTSYSFEHVDETIQVLVDTGSTGNLVLSVAGNASSGSTVYTGVFPNGGSNAYAGLIFQVAGFIANPSNNGTFICTASNATSITLSNSAGVSENQAATAISYGGIYDASNGVLLRGKAIGAGQSYFIALAGVCYIGDGVDLIKYTPLNTNGKTWNWGITAPTTQPNVTVTESGVAAVQWTANTVWSTMGLVYDSASATMFQLNSVNASGTNTTQYGTTGPGIPAAGWSNSLLQSTSDNTLTWKSFGQIVKWTPNTIYNSFDTNGTLTDALAIYDPITKALYVNANQGTDTNINGYLSGSTLPSFKAGVGQVTHDNQCNWLYVGIPNTWNTGVTYPTFSVPTYSGSNALLNTAIQANFLGETITEPLSLKYGLPLTQPVYWQFVYAGGTTASSGIAPFISQIPSGDSFIPAGYIVGDSGDNIWLSLGSPTWAASTVYSGWSASGAIFSALKDTNGNFQVCTTTGTSATVAPQTSFVLTAAANAVGGATTQYTGTFSPTVPVGARVIISGFSTSANNGPFTVISCTATHIVVSNSSGVLEGPGTYALVYNPWNTGYGATTPDGLVVWTCVGTSMSWASNTKWYLPSTGFYPPQSGSGNSVSSAAYGGPAIIDSNGDVEYIINSGKGGSTAPSWNTVGGNTVDGGSPLALTGVAVSGATVTYSGTITGGGSNAFAGKQFVIAGFTNAGNNGLITVASSTTGQLVCALINQQNESGGSYTATTGAIWYNLEAQPTQSLSWTKGYVYAYSYKDRALSDYYSPLPAGSGVTPPGVKAPLGTPTGSETGGISTASPVFAISGSNPGAVNTISGLGSLDPQVDTIVIWRTADSTPNSNVNMFELTEIPNPAPIGGIAQTWTFQDYLPDIPITVGSITYPGLNTLIPAPINDVNDPPPTGFLPMAFHFERIWGAVGSTAFNSGGPDTGVGNGNECFNPVYEWPFLSKITRLLHTANGLITFLTTDIEVIAGGPSITSFYQTTFAPGYGLLSYNALDYKGGDIYFFSADRQFYSLDPNFNIATIGFPIGDKLATFNPSTVYVAVHDTGIDNCVLIADGSTGWWRLNPNQVPEQQQIWSPFAAITGGCQMVQSVVTSPGIYTLLVGATTGGEPILKRDLTVWSDNGSAYDAYLTMGSIVLTHPGQMAELGFVESDFMQIGSQPQVSYLLNEISGTFTSFTYKQFDPPALYGTSVSPSTLYPNRYYFMQTSNKNQNPPPNFCRHLQIKVDFGSIDTVRNEMLNLTIFGAILSEK